MFVIFSSLIVGTKTGYRLYSLNSVDKLENIYESGKMNSLANLKKKNVLPKIVSLSKSPQPHGPCDVPCGCGLRTADKVEGIAF